MKLPTPPDLKQIDRLSPSLYEAGRKCLARASWMVSGNREALPSHPRALLGIAVHYVLEAARKGDVLGATEEEQRTAATMLFDDKMRELFDKTHPLLRAKFDSPAHVPYYNLYRARAAQIAADLESVSQSASAQTTAASRPPQIMIEAELESQDGRLHGRADVLDRQAKTVIDYKTGTPADPSQASDSERRQLRLYAHLAHENGIPVDKGVIERADRTSVELDIAKTEADAEGRQALHVLDEYNSKAGNSFHLATSPAAENCTFCPCIPFCDSFWQQAGPDWAEQCGTHVEGRVVTVEEGEELLTITMEETRGSVPSGDAVVTRLSAAWLTYNGAALPEVGDTIRVTDARYVADTESPAVFKADRITTAVWRADRSSDS